MLEFVCGQTAVRRRVTGPIYSATRKRLLPTISPGLKPIVQPLQKPFVGNRGFRCPELAASLDRCDMMLELSVSREGRLLFEGAEKAREMSDQKRRERFTFPYSRHLFAAQREEIWTRRRLFRRHRQLALESAPLVGRTFLDQGS